MILIILNTRSLHPPVCNDCNSRDERGSQIDRATPTDSRGNPLQPIRLSAQFFVGDWRVENPGESCFSGDFQYVAGKG